VFQLWFDSRHNVLMSRFCGAYSSDDVILRDGAVARFVKKHGPARSIMDFSSVEAITVPMETVVERCSSPPLLRGTPRVILAPTDLTYRFNKVVAALQLYNRRVAPLLVRTMEQAYRALDLGSPRFELVKEEPAALLEETLREVLAKIDKAHGASGAVDDERRKLRARMLRFMEAGSLDTSARVRAFHGSRVFPPAAAITLSDVLNAALSHATLTDSDLKTTCERCGKRLTLGDCTVVAGRETTYSCPACSSLLVVLAPTREKAPFAPERGYPLGTFQIQTAANIECVGALLPRLTLAWPPETGPAF
jgi:hypothetical protein